MIRNLWWKTREMIKERFIETVNIPFNPSPDPIIWVGDKKVDKIGFNVHFKFIVCQEVKTLFGNEGVVQTLANERGGNKYWVKFPDNKLDAWFWENELVFVDMPSFGFNK